MYKDIKDVLDEHYKHLKFDAKLYKQLKVFRVAWMQKSPEYIEFLGGKTLGVQPIRFSTRDDEMLFNDILGIDLAILKTELYKVDGINPAWKVSSNPVYLSIFYLMYKYYTTNNLSVKEQHDVITEQNLIFSYKVIGSLVAHYFGYNASEVIAKATLERLSNKFLIKKLDNWQELFVFRTNDFLPKGLHYDKLHVYTTDDAVRIVNDAQGRIRDIVKNIYEVMIQVIDTNDMTVSTTLLEETEDGVSTKAITERPDKYIVYIRSIYGIRSEFVNDDYIYLLQSIIPNIDKGVLTDTLIYMSEHVDIKIDSDEDFLNISIMKTISYINSKGINTDYNSRIVEILKHMKNYWTSSSVKDKEIRVTKDNISKIVVKATNKKTKWLVAITTVGVMLYIFLRALMKNR